jgi:capsular exopolysaccharide synthesis family protein
MSRIHDALQRAEQERLAAPAVNALANHAEGWEKDAAAVASIPAPGREMPTVDELLAAVRQPDSSKVAESFKTADVRDPMSELPSSPWSPDSHRLLFSSTNGPATVGKAVGEEEFRTLRSRLYRIREAQPLKAVLIGSAVAGEGKTFVTGNLGQVMARQHSQRVLMIDCDLRKPELHTWFGTSCKPGLTEYLRGSADEAAIVQRSPKENLYLIPAGEKVSNPAELLGNGRLNKLLEQIGPSFDWIVFDAPPILPVADASQIATLCDGVLLVVLAGSTSFELAQRARLELKHAPVLGVVLNQVGKNHTYASYHYKYPHVEAKTQ